MTTSDTTLLQSFSKSITFVPITLSQQIVSYSYFIATAFLPRNNACAMTILDFHLQPQVAVLPYKYQPTLKPFSHTRLTMKTQNCVYLLTLPTLSLYTTAMEGKLGVLDKSDWQPIKNIKDHFIQSIGAVSVFQYNKRSGSLLKFVEVFNGDTRVDNGTYYRLDLTAEDGVVTKKYQAIELDRDYFNLISFTPLDHQP